MGEFLRRINTVQEWTVEAALTGDRTLVLEAMMADPMAGQVFVFFILTVAAAESAIGLAILVVLFRTRATIAVDELDTLKG